MIPAWLREHPYLVDAYVALILLVMSTPDLAREMQGEVGWVRPVIAVAMCAPLVARRRYPTPVFVVVAGVAFWQWVAFQQLRPEDAAILIALYTVAAYSRRRDAVLALLVVLGGVGLLLTRFEGPHPERAMIAPAALAVAATIGGDDLRNRRAKVAALAERAERLERERDALAEVAAAAERSRIARELHDVVAHNLSVMVAQADGAAYALDDDPARARNAMETVAETGRGALHEMRRLLGVLRTSASETERSPQPGVDRLPDLVEGVRQAGLSVVLEMTGEPAGLTPGLGLTIFRIVQEALTNTLKHAGPTASAQVRVRFAPEVVDVDVSDDGGLALVGGPARHQAPPDGDGQGLAGMRERVALYDGSLSAGLRAAGGFLVRASFPIRPATS